MDDDAEEDGAPARKRRKDGGFKQSGLREGVHRTPFTLLFKYHVASEFRRNQELKQAGLISNPLECTSLSYNGLAYSNIWNWHAKLEQLKVAVTHETSGCKS